MGYKSKNIRAGNIIFFNVQVDQSFPKLYAQKYCASS